MISYNNGTNKKNYLITKELKIIKKKEEKE